MSNSEATNTSSLNLGKLIVYTTIISIGGWFFYNYYQNNISDYTAIPKEMQISYVPSDFNYEVDEEMALAVLANPHRYRREFNDLIYNFNLSLLHHVASRMDLADSLKIHIEEEYDKHHAYLKQMYFNDFIAIRDTSSNLYEAWYNNEQTSAVAVLNEVASKYSCFLVNHVIMTLLDSTNGQFMAKGRKVDTPCGIAMTEALRPLIKRLQDRAAVADFSRAKGLMEEKVERVIAELATMELRDKKGISKQMQTKIWGISVSSTDIEVSAISLLKVGFKLDKFFELKLDEKKRVVTVQLPQPQILSHEVYPKVDKLDIGWLREVDTEDFNRNFNILRSEFRREALESDIMKKAKNQANELMQMMLGPLVSRVGKNYRLAVRFQKTKSYDESLELAKESSDSPAKSKGRKKANPAADIPFD
ncbi:MAG: DUF4230 domain-containing protein [Bacteroidota bacterium]